MIKKITQEQLYDMSYKIINKKANTNSFVQGLSGIAGFPATLAVDGLVIFTHYQPMIDEIRALYGYAPIEKDSAVPLLRGICKEILIDIAMDKLLGQIPVAGIYFNAICAKALTWRLGMLFTIISSRGEDINYSNLSDVVKLIRNITPQTDMFRFVKPDYDMFKKIVLSVERNDFSEYNMKISNAINCF